MGTVGAYGGYRLARIYDDTTDTINKQYSSAASLPMWMYSQLSQEELGTCHVQLSCARVCVRSVA